jgi:hypothetical protein
VAAHGTKPGLARNDRCEFLDPWHVGFVREAAMLQPEMAGGNMNLKLAIEIEFWLFTYCVLAILWEMGKLNRQIKQLRADVDKLKSEISERAY